MRICMRICMSICMSIYDEFVQLCALFVPGNGSVPSAIPGPEDADGATTGS